jgi:ribosomal protein L7Ae-like RNA K-turn-binding protein
VRRRVAAHRSDVESRDREALNLLGLARRSGRAVIGTRAVRDAAKSGNLGLVLLTRDAGENARNRVVPLLEATRIPWRECGRQGALARAIGRESAVVVGIADPRLAARIDEILGG